MRRIHKSGEPLAFTEWKGGWRGDSNIAYSQVTSDIRSILAKALISEQQGICAYTGIRIREASSHLEHLLPQCHCEKGIEDLDYKNIVACYPAPNTPRLSYGAHQKESWPSRAQLSEFVSPLSEDCESRFVFRNNGTVEPRKVSDSAARETILRLGLNDGKLVSMRRAAIGKTLKNRGLSLQDARKRLLTIENHEQQGLDLEPFCFALKQALVKHIKQVEALRESRRKGKY